MAGRPYTEGTRIKLIVNVSVVLATAVNSQGQSGILWDGLRQHEDGAFRLALVQSLTDGVDGVALEVSDDHSGLRDTISKVFAGAAR